MSLNAQRQLDAILFAHFAANEHLLGGSIAAFSEYMVEVNEALPRGLRTSILMRDGDVYARMTSNGKRLERYKNDQGQHRMPASLVYLFLETIHRRAPEAGVLCARDICRLLGSLYVPVPLGAAGGGLDNLGRVAKEFGEFVVSWAPIGADGRLDALDAPHLEEAIRQTEDLVAAALSAKAQLIQQRDALATTASGA